MSYIEVRGIRTWYSEQGSGEPLILLHGGVVASFLWERCGIVEALAAYFRVFCMDRRAHGFTEDPGGPITYDAMTDDTIAFIEAVGCGPAHLVGYSDGANIGTLLALRRPDLVRRLALMSGNFHYSGVNPAFFTSPGLTGLFAEWAAWYDANSPSGPGHAPELAARLGVEFGQAPTMTEGDLAAISAPTLVIAGDDDAIHLEHLIAQYRAIPNSELAIVPGTSHTLAIEKPSLVNGLLVNFLTKEPVLTLAGIRRAPRP